VKESPYQSKKLRPHKGVDPVDKERGGRKGTYRFFKRKKDTLYPAAGGGVEKATKRKGASLKQKGKHSKPRPIKGSQVSRKGPTQTTIATSGKTKKGKQIF